MPIKMNRDNYDPRDLPSGLSKQTRETIDLAIECGWEVLVANRGHVTLYAPAPNDHVTFGISVKKADRGPVNIVRNRIRRLGDDTYQSLIAHGRPVTEDQRRPIEKKAAPEPKKKAVKKAAPKPKPTVEQPEPEVRTPVRTVVSVQPLIAYDSETKGYLSETTNVRSWSDGTQDFTCRAPGCEFSTEHRRGIRGHWAMHVRNGEVEAVGRKPRGLMIDIPPHEPAWKVNTGPRLARIKALAEFIRSLDLPKIEPEDLAHLMLSWVAEQSNSGTGLAGEREPLTPEQILERIRALVDGGEYLRQRDEMAALREQVAALEERATQAESEAQKAKDTLRTFRELASEYEDEEAS